MLNTTWINYISTAITLSIQAVFRDDLPIYFRQKFCKQVFTNILPHQCFTIYGIVTYVHTWRVAATNSSSLSCSPTSTYNNISTIWLWLSSLSEAWKDIEAISIALISKLSMPQYSYPCLVCITLTTITACAHTMVGWNFFIP